MKPLDPLNITGLVIAEKYQVEGLVGQGGFAVVYRAQHNIWNKPVALKLFTGLSSAPVELRESLQAEFIQEGALLTELSSQTAGIVQARDVGTCTTPDGQWLPYMVLEWLDGTSLEDVLESDRQQRMNWSLAETMGFLARVLPVLQVAHARGIAHRDIKPANLFVLRGGARSSETPIKLLDFGVAKMVSDHAQFKAALAKTGVGISAFTPQYGAPEQFTRSYGATGPWTDVYAMALIGVEMLTGKEALEGDDLVQLGFSSASPKRPTPNARGAKIPPEIEAVFLKALSVEPRGRYASAGEFLDAALAATGLDFGTASGRTPFGSSPGLAGSLSRGSEPGASEPRGESSSIAPIATERPGLHSHPTVAAATLKTPRAQPRRGKLAPAMATLIILVSLTAVFAASDMEGAAETRNVLSELLVTVRDKVSGHRGGDLEPEVAVEAVRASASSSGSVPPSASVSAAEHADCADDMLLVTAGAQVGSEEQPQPFCIEKNEVTVASYRACVERGRCERPKNETLWPESTKSERAHQSQWCTFGGPENDALPVNCVSWSMAETYCRAQSRRLPSDKEWLLAAQGPDQRPYPWGKQKPVSGYLNACGLECKLWARANGLSLKAMYAPGDDFPQLAPPGSFEKDRSPFGLNDVAGNVSEWVSEWHQPSEQELQLNPTLAKERYRVVRGGAWNTSNPLEVRLAYRAGQDPTTLLPSIGFRCAAGLGED